MSIISDLKTLPREPLPRPPRPADDGVEETLRALREAKDADEIRSLQAVLLPLLGCSLEVTAQAVGRDRFWVSRTRNRILDGGPVVVKRGGRRRETVSTRSEVELVEAALERATLRWGGAPPMLREALRELIDASTQTYVDDATLTRILNRTAPQIVPGAKGEDLARITWALQSIYRGMSNIHEWMTRLKRW